MDVMVYNVTAKQSSLLLNIMRDELVEYNIKDITNKECVEHKEPKKLSYFMILCIATLLLLNTCHILLTAGFSSVRTVYTL